MRRFLPVAAFAAAGLVGACTRTPDPPGTLDAKDQQQLNEAATMLDADAGQSATGNSDTPR